MLIIDEEEFKEQSQEALDKMWEWYESIYHPRRDLPVDSPRRDSSPPGPEERGTGGPVQS